MIKILIKTDNDTPTIFIRIMVGAVFLSEGIQKFLFPALRGTGRFTKMGFPNPVFFSSFVGVFEILCGMMILLGLITRFGDFAMWLGSLFLIFKGGGGRSLDHKYQ